MIVTNPAHILVVTNHSNTATQALQHTMIQTNPVRNYISVTNDVDQSQNQSLKPKLVGIFPLQLGKRDLQALGWIFEKSFRKRHSRWDRLTRNCNFTKSTSRKRIREDGREREKEKGSSVRYQYASKQREKNREREKERNEKASTSITDERTRMRSIERQSQRREDKFL